VDSVWLHTKKKKNSTPWRRVGTLLSKEHETSVSHFLNFDISFKGVVSLVLQSPLPRATFELEVRWAPRSVLSKLKRMFLNSSYRTGYRRSTWYKMSVLASDNEHGIRCDCSYYPIIPWVSHVFTTYWNKSIWKRTVAQCTRCHESRCFKATQRV
jgi:hypothetical protein